MTNTFTYRNFDLSILMTAQTGGKILVYWDVPLTVRVWGLKGML